MKHDNLLVVVIGGLHHNTLGVIRSLGEANIPKQNITGIIVCEEYIRYNFLSASKYIDSKKVKVINRDDKILDVLDEVKIETKKQVIICCSDSSAEVVMKNYKKLNEWYYTPNVRVGISDLMSKQNQCDHAICAGLLIPKSIVLKKSTCKSWDVFPCITKPLICGNGGGKADIHIAHNKAELLDAISLIDSEMIQIQEYIKKDMEYQLIGCSLDGGDEIIIPGYTKIIRQPENTNTGYLIYSPIEDLEFDYNAVKRFIKQIGYSGLFSLEFLRDKKGHDYFLEINLRNDGNAYCVQSAGINLPYIWCYYNYNNSLPSCELQFKKPIYFIPDLSDIKRGIKSVGMFQWINQFINAESHAVFNIRDMKPFIVQIISKFI